MEAGGGLSMVSELHFVEGSGPGAPPEVICSPTWTSRTARTFVS
jgi:hypothetical protein